MTREEAIKRLDEQTFKELAKEPCEDCVSRQAVLDIWNTTYSDNREENEETQYKEIAFELPSVTPQPNTGHWIDVAGGCECSECGCLEAGYSNFCPDCGAKMEVEE